MEATIDELAEVPGIGRKTAASVYSQLHEGECQGKPCSIAV
ncbi:MAG: hypothetical protein D3925_20735, partial [Candidatus Electrothrix sp. AR5]|nr:hypothetical protein [Candidatus Electrothrix sp. AR5]